MDEQLAIILGSTAAALAGLILIVVGLFFIIRSCKRKNRNKTDTHDDVPATQSDTPPAKAIDEKPVPLEKPTASIDTAQVVTIHLHTQNTPVHLEPLYPAGAPPAGTARPTSKRSAVQVSVAHSHTPKKRGHRKEFNQAPVPPAVQEEEFYITVVSPVETDRPPTSMSTESFGDTHNQFGAIKGDEYNDNEQQHDMYTQHK